MGTSEKEVTNNITTTTETTPYDYHRALLNIISTAKQNFVLMGELLYQLKVDDNYLEAVGEGIDTWIDYIKQPEIGLSKGEANRLIDIYHYFINTLGFKKDYIANVPIKNLHYLLPIVKKMEDKEDVSELLNEATHLSQKDFRERVYDIKSDDGERTYTYVVMKKCNETNTMERVYDIESEDIVKIFKINEN